MKWGWDWTCSMRLGSRILGVLSILCIAGFKRREKWVSSYQMEYIYIYIYSIMKTVCAPSYHRNGFVVTHALGDMIYIHPSCFCEIWSLCVLWITSDHLHKYIHYINIYTHKHTHTDIYIIYIYIHIYTLCHICIYVIYVYIYIHIWHTL